jgi:hypothetical protein
MKTARAVGTALLGFLANTHTGRAGEQWLSIEVETQR